MEKGAQILDRFQHQIKISNNFTQRWMVTDKSMSGLGREDRW